MKLIRKAHSVVPVMSAKSHTNDPSSSASSRSVATTNATEPTSGWAEGRRRRESTTTNTTSSSPPTADAGNDDESGSVATTTTTSPATTTMAAAAAESRQAGDAAPSPSIASTSSRSIVVRGTDVEPARAAAADEERCDGTEESVVVVDNDEAIAHALAQEEADAEAKRMASLGGWMQSMVVPGVTSSAYPGGNRGADGGGGVAPAGRTNGGARSTPPTPNCPAGCGLRPFHVPTAQAVRCNRCDRRLGVGETVHGCVSCDYDVCDSCFRGRDDVGRDASSPSAASSSAAASSLSPRPGVSARGTPHVGPPGVPPFMAAPPPTAPPPHMCIVPCVLGDGVGVEMMVDSGAQLSVISLPLARELNLENRIDARHVGVAAGVGRARIAGKIHHVICSLGNVEFEMDFMVLDCADRLLLLGLDQMRKYKCIVDLENDRLVFGGHGGVEVPMLPPMEDAAGALANRSAMSSLGDQMGCPMM